MGARNNMDFIKILGYIEPIKFIIRLNDPHAKKAFLNSHTLSESDRKWLLVYYHELAHYLQLIGTNVGRRISNLSISIEGQNMLLIRMFPKKINIPITGWIKNNPSLIENLEWNEAIIDRLAGIKILKDEYVELYSPWHFKVFEAYQKSGLNSISSKQLIKGKSITLNSKTGIINVQIGNFRFKEKVTAYQIMESMAKLVELRQSGILSDSKEFLHKCTNLLELEYNFPILYLIQEGIMEIENWTFILHFYLQSICQLSLMMNPVTIQNYWSENKLNSLSDMHNNMKIFNPGRIFLETIQSMENCKLFLDLATTKSVFIALDAICKKHDFPIYTKMVDFGIKEIEYEKGSFDDKERLTNHIKIFENMFAFKIPQNENFSNPKLDLCEKVYEIVKSKSWYYVSPIEIMFQSKIPIPPVQFFDDSIAVHPESREVWNHDFREDTFRAHILNKLFRENNLACYSNQTPTNELINCNMYEQCLKKKKENELGFCENEAWKEIVNGVLRFLEIEEINPISQMEKSNR